MALLRRLGNWFSPSIRRDGAHALYAALVEQSRQPAFYRDLGVPDTLDGRFEILVLHLFIALHCLKNFPFYDAMGRELTEVYIHDMDRNLREAGVGDMGVGKRVKKMAAALLGHMLAYEKALGSDAALRDALRRNVYGTVQADDAMIARLAEYVRRMETALKAQTPEAFLRGELTFTDII